MYDFSSCCLCPRECGADRLAGNSGICGCSDKIKIARYSLHQWEEPCISGEHGSGTVFFSGCNMRCVFCQNHVISAGGKGFEVDTERLAEIFMELQEMGAHNINLVTPTHFAPQIMVSLDTAKIRGLKIPVVYNTSGYEKTDTLKMLDGYVDIYMPDMKYKNSKYSEKYSYAEDYFSIAQKALKEMFRQTGPVQVREGIMQKGMIVRHLMLPGLLLDTKKVVDYLYRTYGDDIYISLMSQYTPLPHIKDFPELDRTINKKSYEAMVNYCVNEGMNNVFIQEGESASESFIPEFFDGQ